MIVTHKISIDLFKPEGERVIYAVQDDRYSRNLEISLFSGGAAWPIPEDAAVSIRYSKSDGKGGQYDTLPDGTGAWRVSGNILTVALAPQVLTVAGPVFLAVTLIRGTKEITTFPILLKVHPNLHTDIEDSEHYYSTTGFLRSPETAKVGQYFQVSAIDECGHVTAVEAVDAPEAEVHSVKNFGAKGDGETDDTDAVQAALDAGGIVYFPAGVYRVTRQLTTNVPCTIRMERIYPGSADENITASNYGHPQADYPTEDANMGFGARIETGATDGIGLLVTDGSSVDGLAIRAMSGFKGVLLKYDGSRGCRSYPSTTRLRHIKADCDVAAASTDTMPESLFDFCPHGNYGTIVEDVIIGSNHIRQYAKYGFRSSLSFWANSIRIRDMVVDVVAEYPFYINANGYQAKNWTISNVAVQAFPCKSTWVVTAHQNIAYLNGLSDLYISGCKLWDVNTDEGAENPTTVIGDVIGGKVISAAAFGNDSHFDSLDTVLTAKLEKANELNLAKLTVSVETDSATGNHTVTLSDGTTEPKSFEIPATALSEDQIAKGITHWMEENADPKPVVGKNKLNPEECFDGTLDGGAETGSDYFWATGFIPCSLGDTVRFYDNQTPPVARTLTRYYLYDANKNVLNGGSSFTPTSGAIAIETEGTAYIRMIVGKTGNWALLFDDRDTCMVTVNTTMGAFEPYTVTMEGGIASYIDLDAIAEKIDLTEYLKKTEADAKYALKTEITDVPSYTTETWTFELEDGSAVTRTVVLA